MFVLTCPVTTILPKQKGICEAIAAAASTPLSRQADEGWLSLNILVCMQLGTHVKSKYSRRKSRPE